MLINFCVAKWCKLLLSAYYIVFKPLHQHRTQTYPSTLGSSSSINIPHRVEARTSTLGSRLSNIGFILAHPSMYHIGLKPERGSSLRGKCLEKYSVGTSLLLPMLNCYVYIDTEPTNVFLQIFYDIPVHTNLHCIWWREVPEAIRSACLKINHISQRPPDAQTLCAFGPTYINSNPCLNGW